MKILAKALPVLLAVLGLVSCSKELSQETGAEVNTGGNFTATINGEGWTADSLEQVLVTDSLVTITGVSKTGQEISMVLSHFALGKTGMNSTTTDYALYTKLGGNATDVYLTTASKDVAKASGTVEITAIDTVNKTVTGTFSFNAYRNADQTTVSVTTGVFNAIAYSGSAGGTGGVTAPPVDNGRDTLSAYIDNTLFVAGPSSNISGVESPVNQGQPNEVRLITILATNESLEAITITFKASLTPGTYAMSYQDPNGPVALLIPDPSTYYAPISSGAGSLTILTTDATNKRVSGQFNFKGTNIGPPPVLTDTKMVTKGYFAVTYQ